MLQYHKAARSYVHNYYEKDIYFMYELMWAMAREAKAIARSVSLEGMEYQNALVATWFRFVGAADLMEGPSTAGPTLLKYFFDEVSYPEADRVLVQEAIAVAEGQRMPLTKMQQVVCDALNSRLAQPDFLDRIVMLKEEMNRHMGISNGTKYFTEGYHAIFLKTLYYTGYAQARYVTGKNINQQLMVKKMQGKEKLVIPETKLNNRETEDLFKIAFRNYNHLVSVADSKAALLIRVSSVMTSVMLAFGISKTEEYPQLLWPVVLLLVTCMLTILLSILASRPQQNSFSEEASSHSYQHFFFGSFDLIDPRFRHVDWKSFYDQLNSLFGGQRQRVYIEACKELYNVRKVLSKKFSYLSIAYWVFISGLLLSIAAFIYCRQL
ncbi:Pycsar system effector family protein [Chitinophaga sp.]|uniref:Pycsar system effector family protein n=1 Tax=Chitinophaga sp. TaxID=1869181 RepID=UPI0031E36D62